MPASVAGVRGRRASRARCRGRSRSRQRRSATKKGCSRSSSTSRADRAARTAARRDWRSRSRPCRRRCRSRCLRNRSVRQRDAGDRQRLVGEGAEAEQGDRRDTGSCTVPTNIMPVISSAPRVKAQRRASISAHAAPLQPQGHGRPEQAAEIGGDEGQPGEQRDLLEIEAARRGEVERHPEGSVPQVGSARKRGSAMPQKLRWREQRQDRRLVAPPPARCASCPACDMRALLRRERGMRLGRAIEAQPQQRPEQGRARRRRRRRRASSTSGSHQTTSGAASIDAERGADIVDAAGEAALLRRKPFGRRP